MTLKRAFLGLLGVILVAFVLIAGAGIYNFNILGDDVYFDAAAAKQSDLVGRWSVTESSLNSEMHLFTDGSVRMESDVTTEYGTWDVADGQLILDIVIDDDRDETRLEILTWNETQLRVETPDRGESALTRKGWDDATPRANLPLTCPEGVKVGTHIAFGGYTLPSGEIDSMAFDMLEGVPQIDLSVSEEAALDIRAESANYLGKPLPIALDGVLIAAPVTQEEIGSQGLQIFPREATVPFVFDTLSADCLNN